MGYNKAERNMTMAIIPEKEQYVEEINKIDNAEIRGKLLDLYDHLKGVKKLKNVKLIIKDVLKDMFGINLYTTDILIPYSFIDSIIGRVVFSIIFNTEENSYTINDFVEFTKTPEKPKGLSVQYIGQEIKRGNLKATLNGGRWEIAESDAQAYLLKKGYKGIE